MWFAHKELEKELITPGDTWGRLRTRYFNLSEMRKRPSAIVGHPLRTSGITTHSTGALDSTALIENLDGFGVVCAPG
jgi:hypothetical protein